MKYTGDESIARQDGRSRPAFALLGDHPIAVSQPPWVSTMTDEYQQPKRQDGALPSLNTAIGTLNASSITLVMAVFGSTSVLLTTIRVGFLPVRAGQLLTNVYRTQWSTKRSMSSWD